MRNAVQLLLNAIDRESGGVAIVWCPDFGLRDWLVDHVEGLVPDENVVLRTDDVETALAAPNRLVLLTPLNEREAVLDLDGGRDRILEPPARTQPIILFLLREGDGATALRQEAPSLRSWVSGSDADPEALAEIDVGAERRVFEREHGMTVEAWLAHWRAGVLSMTGLNYRMAFHASSLESGAAR